MPTDVMILGANHSILASNISGNKNTPEFVQKFFELAKKDKNSLDSFGLFGGSNNYHTFYPDAKPEDNDPKDEEFIEPMFRMLSNCVVAKPYNPTEFPAEVLKESMQLLVGQTVNCDHETDIANAIGTVKEVFWQDAYKTEDGIEIPGGINAVLKIDGKSNPRIARGINMDPPSIHSNSVTVQFEWKPSHQFEDPDEFYRKLGKYDDKGEMVRRIATKIISYRETSLVSHGADPFAQKIEDGKIVNPGYAGSVYQAYKDEPLTAEGLRNIMGNVDFKGVDVMHNTGDFFNKGNNSQTFNKDMNEELQEFLEKLFGENMLNLAEGSTPTTDAVITGIQNLLSEKVSLSEAKAQLEEKITSLSADVESWKAKSEANEKMAKIGTDYLSDLRNQTVQAYTKLFTEEKVDNNIINLINADTTNMETLISLKASYEASLEEKFPLHCSKCGSTEVNRGSYMVENNEDQSFGDSSILDSVKKIAKQNRRK